MMRKGFALITAILLLAVVFLGFSGCDFSTRIISDADTPDKVLDKFFDELKAENYASCDQYLADNATFVINDISEYDVMDELIELEIENLKYELLGETKFTGVTASCEVKIYTLNAKKLTEIMKENIGSIEYAYLVERGEKVFDKDNAEQVSDVIKIALEKCAPDAGIVENTVTVGFKYQDNSWKISVDSDFVSAIFGGCGDE